jgi:putative addiction module component (TIGR02574 family)
MSKITLADILDLPVDERILLVEDIWDSIAAFPEAVPLTEEQREELDRRLAAYHQNPESGLSWEEVKGRLRGL